MSNLNNKRIERGVRWKGNGIEAYLMFNGERYWRFFPIDTPIENIREWRKNHPCRRGKWGRSFSNELKRPHHFPVALTGCCYLYIVRCQAHAKIGRTVNLEERMSRLQQGSPLPLTLLAAIPAHTSLEALVHKQFADTRADGEWFHVTGRLLQFAKHLRSNKNPLTFFWPVRTPFGECEERKKDELDTAPSTSSAQPVENGGAVVRVAHEAGSIPAGD